jgi:putative ABC transport system substrate-binding protein
MNRRQVIAGLSVLPWVGAAAAAGRVYRIAIPLAIGNLTTEAASQDKYFYGPLIEKLRKTGFVLGDNLRFEFPTVDGHFDRLPDLAAEVVRSKPDVIFCTSNPLAYDIKNATNDIPVVAYMNEAVLGGFAKSFARPGGNFTGLTWTIEYLWCGKKFDLLRQTLPKAKRAAFLYTENVRGTIDERYVKHFAEKAGFEFVEAYLRSPVTSNEFRRVFQGLGGQNVDAVVVAGQPETWANVELMVRLAQEFRVPVLYGSGAGAVQLGGLVDLGAYPNWEELVHLTADYLSRVLKGSRPAEMPIFHTDRAVVGVNLKTAKALGVELSEHVIARATTVIE